jgi:hypothetical protein
MIVYNLMQGEENKGGIREFIEANDKVDLVRGESLVKIVPELQEVYEWAKEN